ncbi:MAG: AMP-binding protein [Alphaproteobacteria bacterium]|nr:AMP-binding protein [Alphaproteobacteria bacterium]
MVPASLLPHPDDALVCHGPGVGCTAGELRARVAALAAGLAPVEAPRPVACRGRLATLVAILACWERGEAALLPANHAPDTLAALAGPHALHDGLLEAGTDLRTVSPGAARALLARPPATRRLVRLSTSGSTGEAQLHDKTAGQLLGEVDVLGPALTVPHGVRVLATIPAHHVYGLLFSVLLPLARGGSFNDDAPLFAEAVAARRDEAGATVLVSVPAHLRTLAEAPAGTWSGLRTVVSSGAPLPLATARAWADRHGLGVTEVFGSTETGGIATRVRVEDEAWTPLPGVSVAADLDGRLLLDSPFLDPAAPRPRPCDDRVVVHPDGRFRHEGRLDDVVKIASKRLSLGAITAAILEVEGVRDAAVVARTATADGPERLHALVAGDPGLAGAIRQALAARFDPVGVPRLVFVEALPREPHGKLPRAAILAALDGVSTRDVQVPADHPAFQGHFPGMPLLPAVVIVQELAADAARLRWPDLGPLVALRRWRFRAPVEPDSTVTVELRRPGGAGAVRAVVRRGDTVCAEGELLHDAGAPEPRH